EPADTRRHQRLPAAGRRHPGVRARAGPPAAARLAGRLRLDLAGVGRVRRGPAVPGHPASDVDAAAHPGGRPPGRRRGPGRGLHRGLVRRGGAARAAGAGAAQGRGGAGGRRHPRARGRLGRGPRRPAGAAPDRRRRGRADLPRRVHPQPARPRRRPRPPAGTAAAGGGHRRLPTRRGRDGDPRAAPARRPADRGLRVPPGAPQGPGHAGQGLAGGAAADARSGAAGRRPGPGPAPAAPARRRDRGRPGRRVHRRRALGRAARALRGRGRVRDAVPDPAPRAGCRGPRHRLPRSLRDRAAGDRRRLRRGAGRGAARGDRLGGAGPVGAAGRRPGGHPARRPGRRGRHGRQGPGLGGARVALGHPGRPAARPPAGL
ncbi:MAG: Phosphatidylinositol alpha-mannosyltransferase, partial [uncultured Corynebacteriales bacterium]